MSIRRAIPLAPALPGDLAASRDFYAGFLGFDVAMDEEGFTTFASPSDGMAEITVADKDNPPVRTAVISVAKVQSRSRTSTRCTPRPSAAASRSSTR